MKRCALLGVVVGTCAGGAVADTVVVPCGRDNTLYESITGTVSNGSGPYFFVGMTTGGERRRGLIRFDVASAIPAGSTVTGVLARVLPYATAGIFPSRRMRFAGLLPFWARESA